MSNLAFTPQVVRVLSFVLDSAEKFGSPKQIVLFGSRARRDHRALSDYDIAVAPDSVLNGNWTKFWNLVDEGAPTLCKIDLVNLAEDLSESFRAQIQAQGVVFHQKAESNESK